MMRGLHWVSGTLTLFCGDLPPSTGMYPEGRLPDMTPEAGAKTGYLGGSWTSRVAYQQ